MVQRHDQVQPCWGGTWHHLKPSGPRPGVPVLLFARPHLSWCAELCPAPMGKAFNAVNPQLSWNCFNIIFILLVHYLIYANSLLRGNRGFLTNTYSIFPPHLIPTWWWNNTPTASLPLSTASAPVSVRISPSGLGLLTCRGRFPGFAVCSQVSWPAGWRLELEMPQHYAGGWQAQLTWCVN